jgi:hypothetical protein
MLAAFTAHASGAAPAEQPRSQTGKITPSARPPATKSGSSARGALPDPVLLDGSTQAPEKKSEYGMIGDFELPGDENAKNGKVGGPPGQPGQQGQQQQQGAGGMPMGLPQGGGAGQQAQQQAEKAGAQGQQGGQQGPENPNAAGNQVAGAGDPNAKPEGVQVAQLEGQGSGQQIPAGEKPPPVAIGDSAMQIKTSAPSPGVVGAQQVPSQNTQQHDKGTGSGGKGPTGTQGPGRVEKGRTIPAGL